MLQFLKSSVGRKYIMGFTGMVWSIFVLGHMLGNCLILVSPEAYNAYGHAIVSNKLLLYGTETILLFALFSHVVCAVSLTLDNRRAKGKTPAMAARGDKSASLASRTMAFQGSLILAFVIHHLALFKYGTYYETTVNGVVMRDLARLIFEVFQHPGYLAIYLVGLVLLGFHLSHGVGSIFQSFGFLHPKYQPKIRTLSLAYGAVVSVGFLSQPIFVFLIK